MILFCVVAGLYTWNTDDIRVDIETELNIISDCAPPGEEARGGEINKINKLGLSCAKLGLSCAKLSSA